MKTSSRAPESVFEAAIGMNEVELATQSQRFLSACMKNKGFKYVSSTKSAGVPLDALDSSGQYSKKEFVKRYGFGITTLPDRRLLSKDPNDIIFSNLPSTEKDQYLDALIGARRGERTSPLSCRGRLTKVTQKPSLITLQKKLETKLAELEQSRTVRELYKSWSRCFKAKTGLHYLNPEAVFDFVAKAADNPTTNQTELAVEEVKLANASFECQIPELAQLAEIRRNAITRFLDQNRGSIDHVSFPSALPRHGVVRLTCECGKQLQRRLRRTGPQLSATGTFQLIMNGSNTLERGGSADDNRLLKSGMMMVLESSRSRYGDLQMQRSWQQNFGNRAVPTGRL